MFEPTAVAYCWQAWAAKCIKIIVAVGEMDQ